MANETDLKDVPPTLMYLVKIVFLDSNFNLKSIETDKLIYEFKEDCFIIGLIDSNFNDKFNDIANQLNEIEYFYKHKFIDSSWINLSHFHKKTEILDLTNIF